MATKVKNFICIPQQVKVRRYEVDKTRLIETLRSAKDKSNRQIASELEVPLTNVEHWFRTDNCFSIPSAEIWWKLKRCLGIKTNEFDVSITTFDIVDGVFEKAERCYFAHAISPTITAVSDCGVKVIVWTT